MCVLVQVSGREVFEFRPELVDDDDDEADDTQYANNEDEEEEEEVEVRRLFTLRLTIKLIFLRITVACWLVFFFGLM